MITIDFEINNFKDALHLADNYGFTQLEIEVMKQERYNKWRDFIDNPPPVVDEE